MTVLPCLMYTRDSSWVLSVWLSEIYGSRIRCPLSCCGKGLVTILPVNRSWVTAVLRLLPSFLFWQSWSGQGSTQQPLANWDWIKSTLNVSEGFGASPECVCSLGWLRTHMWCQASAHPASTRVYLQFLKPVLLIQGAQPALSAKSHSQHQSLDVLMRQPGIQRKEMTWGLGYVFTIFKNFSREWRKRNNKRGLERATRAESRIVESGFGVNRNLSFYSFWVWVLEQFQGEKCV